jgi:hypothetical protein
MLSLTEWLNKVGLGGQNPFALKQADDEGELLQAYFVEHPAYNALLDLDRPRSSVLHAPRGAGKSSTRRMFERYCTANLPLLRPLLVHLMDWSPVINDAVSIADIRVHHHIQEILRQVVRSLALDATANVMQIPEDADLAGYLNWICTTYDTYLTPGQRNALVRRGCVSVQDSATLSEYTIQHFTPVQQLTLLAEVLRASGYTTCYVLVDRIDELLETAADWEAGATMLAPLVSNLQLTEIPILAFKYFIPSEIVEILLHKNLLRTDRIGCFKLGWDDTTGQSLLKKMLVNRLDVFSNGQVRSLASLATPDLRVIDEDLIAAAHGSPRQLLNLGEELFQACADDADDNNLLIQPKHLELALAKFSSPKISASSTMPAKPTASEASADTKGMATPEMSMDCVLPLRIKENGSIWRGDELINDWEGLPSLQRELLMYLYKRRGELCYKEEIVAAIWDTKQKPVSDDSLRKLVERLIQFIEPDPDNPVYIRKVRGGHYTLENTDD